MFKFGLRLLNSQGEEIGANTNYSTLNVILPMGRSKEIYESGNGYKCLMFELGDGETAVIQGIKEGEYLIVAEKDIYFSSETGETVAWSNGRPDYVRYGCYFTSPSGLEQEPEEGIDSEIGRLGWLPGNGKFMNYIIAWNHTIRPSAGFASISGWNGFAYGRLEFRTRI